MPIPLQQVLAVAYASYENAEELLIDAEVLFQNQRWARVIFLCSICEEEMAESILSVWSAIRLRLGQFEATHERRYRKCFRDHKLRTATLQLVEDFLFSLRPVEELRDRFDNGNLEIDDREKVKMGSLYVDFGPKSILVPGRFFSTPEKVDMTLKLTRRRMEIFQGSIVPLFDTIPACDLEQCRTWISHLREIV